MSICFHLTISVVFTLTVPGSIAKKTYEGYRLIQVLPTSAQQIQALELLQKSNQWVDFWTPILKDQTVDISVAPNVIDDIEEILKKSGLRSQEIIHNIKQSIQMEENSMTQMAYVQSSFVFQASCIDCPNPTHANIVGRFARHSDINRWLNKIATQNPSIAAIETIGKSTEGREMRLIKIGKGIDSRSSFSSKPIIWIDAGIHAREWIAPAVAVFIINKFITDYNIDANATWMLNTFDWYILPSANPDGYEYSHTTDRLWRKTRSRQSGICYGADPNRNFDINFGASGVSTNPCSSIYPGKYAFSEPETTNMRDAISKIKSRVKAYLSFHAYSQMLLAPYGFTRSKPQDYSEMMRVAKLSTDSLRQVNGKSFRYGSVPDLLYIASGSSGDWAKARAGIKYSYTYELRPAFASWRQSGFILREQEIIPSGEEVWASLVTLSKEIL